MLKKSPKSKVKPADTLLKTTKKKDIELTEKELDKVSGGRLTVATGVHIRKAEIF